MNWRRGIFRAWIVLSIAWTAFVLIVAIGNMGPTAPSDGWALEYWKQPLFAMALPWIVSAAIFGALWISRGFKPNQ